MQLKMLTRSFSNSTIVVVYFARLKDDLLCARGGSRPIVHPSLYRPTCTHVGKPNRWLIHISHCLTRISVPWEGWGSFPFALRPAVRWCNNNTYFNVR